MSAKLRAWPTTHKGEVSVGKSLVNKTMVEAQLTIPKVKKAWKSVVSAKLRARPTTQKRKVSV